MLFTEELQVSEPSGEERFGVVTLASEHLHFAHSGLDRLEAGAVGLDVGIDGVRDVHLGAGFVDLETGGGHFRFHTARSVPLCLATP